MVPEFSSPQDSPNLTKLLLGEREPYGLEPHRRSSLLTQVTQGSPDLGLGCLTDSNRLGAKDTRDLASWVCVHKLYVTINQFSLRTVFASTVGALLVFISAFPEFLSSRTVYPTAVFKDYLSHDLLYFGAHSLSLTPLASQTHPSQAAWLCSSLRWNQGPRPWVGSLWFLVSPPLLRESVLWSSLPWPSTVVLLHHGADLAGQRGFSRPGAEQRASHGHLGQAALSF
uniref:Uncharacterized protein LOC110199399 isoform X2 n=1 Tax=Phascolarctos cinereus TaxID=38626 RepID=A0A6P5JFN3_PHACI|nr:uncharacterized protein LOC110199399 isoform X2 [Phascolarctos cinereus]